MIQIYLDGMMAALPDKTSIKFTAENPYFTKTTSYTYEIELPLSIPENRRIFGFIDRIDVSKEERTLSARLIVDARTLLTGTAHITSITSTSVKVQLLGSAASYNYGNKMADTYIDELDLGDWKSTTFPSLFFGKYSGTTSQLISLLKGKGGSLTPRPSSNIPEGPDLMEPFKVTIPVGTQPWVAFPVLNSTADIKCNDFAFYEHTEGKRDFEMKLRAYHGSRKTADDNPTIDSIAVQPYVWFMAEKIAQATGFTLRREDNYLYTNSFFRRIFIANANNCLECNKCLPHWSVNDWWTEVENTFGVIMTVDFDAKTLSLTSRHEYYSHSIDKRIDVKNILDEYTVDIEDDTQKDISVSSVGFADFDHGSEDLLSEFVMENAVVNDKYADASSLLSAVASQGTGKQTLFKCADGRQFIFATDCDADAKDRLVNADSEMTVFPGSDGGRVTYAVSKGKGEGIEEVNMFRPRLVGDTEEAEVKLRFVPARTIFIDADLYLRYQIRPGVYGYKESPTASFPVVAIERPDRADMDWYKDFLGDDIDIEAIIKGEADEGSSSESSSDVIYIAIDNPVPDNFSVDVKIAKNENFKGQFSYPRAILRERTLALLNGGVTVEDPGVSLSLIPIDGQTNLASETIADGIAIDTRSRYCIKFIASSIPDVAKVFNIRNRLFVCEKIEADISVAGLGKLFTGYFYEVNISSR